MVTPRVQSLGDLGWAAATVALWFDAPLQMACDEVDETTDSELSHTYTALNTRPALHVSADGIAEDLSEQLEQFAPSVAVLPLTDAGMQLAAQLCQPGFLVPEMQRRRLPTGPLVIPLHNGKHELGVLAVAALWADELGCDVRLVSVGEQADGGAQHRAVTEIRALGITVEVDTVTNLAHETMAIASTHQATAVVLSAAAGLDLEHRYSMSTPLIICPSVDRGTGRSDLSREPNHQQVTLEALSTERSMDLIATRSIGRIGYVETDIPHVVPINYRAHEGDIYIRSLPGQKLSTATAGAVVCLEVDQLNETSHTGWSVVLHGELNLIDDPQVLATAWESGPDAWIAAKEYRWLRLRPMWVSGRRISS